MAEYNAMPVGAFLELAACCMIENGAAPKGMGTEGPCADLDEIMIPV